jgi:hypothetical protein
MMKVILFFLSLFFSSLISKASDPFYSQKIYAEPIDDISYKKSLEDLKQYLSEITRQKFEIVYEAKNQAGGIRLRLNTDGLLRPPLSTQLNKGTIEDFVLIGDKDQLQLIANHPLGLSRAVYFYLDKLGVKWYFPGKEWSFVPSLKDIRLTESEWVSPSFHQRDFFGTGSIIRITSLDPAGSLEEAWSDWKRRNRMGGEAQLAGHYGEAFNLIHRAALEQNPGYLAMVNGKREWNVSSKWCISNKGLRDLFIRDRVEELKKAIQNNKYPNQKIVLSADPADGGGECECEQCRKMGSVSDRTFFLANEVAKEFAKISPNAYVNIYAYSAHAATPSFRLNPNLIVQLIPYAFQRFYAPEVMIRKWKDLHDQLFMYDYYGLPDWHWDQPLSKDWSVYELVKKIQYWKQQGILGFMLESSYSAAGPGLGLYVAGRLGWDNKEPVSGILETFYKNAFGKAAGFMKAYYAKVNEDFAGPSDLPYLLDLLDKAGRAEQGAVFQQRINGFKAYVHYLSLYYDWKKSTALESEKKGEALYSYILRMYDLRMVHSTRLAQLLVQQLKDQQQWRLYEPVGPGVAKLRPVTASEIAANFEKDKEAYPLLEGFQYVRKAKSPVFSIKNKADTSTFNADGMMLYQFPETYVRPGEDGVIRFQLKVNDASKANYQQVIKIELLDTASGEKVYSQDWKIDRNWQRVSIKTKKNRDYKLSVAIPDWIRFSGPGNQWVAFTNIPTYSVMGPLWFYVPPSDKYIYYSNRSLNQPVFTNKAGKKLQVEKVNDKDLYRVHIDAGGQWLRMESSEYKFLQFHSPLVFFPHANFTVAQ